MVRLCHDIGGEPQISHCTQDVATLNKMLSGLQYGEANVEIDTDKNKKPSGFCTCFTPKCNSLSLNQFQLLLKDEPMTSMKSTSNNMFSTDALFHKSAMDGLDDSTSKYTSLELFQHTTITDMTNKTSTIEDKMSTAAFKDVNEEITPASAGKEHITTSETDMAPNFQSNTCLIFVILALRTIFSAL